MLKRKPRIARNIRPGFGLIDAILSLAIVAIIGILLGSLAQITRVNSLATHRLQAAVIADEVLNSLKQKPYESISDQTNQSAVAVLANAGRWNIATNSSSLDVTSSPCPPATSGWHCGQTVLEVTGGASFNGNLNGRLQLPADAYENTTFQASWYVHADSPGNWIVGYLIRANDSRNGYRLRLGSASTDLGTGAGTQNVVFEKLVNGTITNLFTSSGVVNVPVSTWFSLRVVMNGNSFSVYRDGALLTGGTFTDSASAFAVGRVALAAWNGAHADIDDVTEIDPSGCAATPAKCWNFEGSTTMPTAWTRFGQNDLPNTSPDTFDDNIALTIEPWPAGATEMKRVTVTVTWHEPNGDQAYTAVGYLRKDNIGS